MQTETLQEYEIGPELQDQIIHLRNRCFPEYQRERSYYKQIPHFRMLVLDQDRVIAQMGVDHRVISVGKRPVRIFGIIDLCVDTKVRGKGIASELIDRATDLASSHEIDFLFLLADDHRVYKNSGFVTVDEVCQWLRIHDHCNYGVAMERMTDTMMFKKIGSKDWPAGPVDLLGYMF